VTHDREIEIPESLHYLRAALERSHAVGQRLIGLHLEDARELAARSGCHLRVVRRTGPGSIVTAELDWNRFNVEIEDDVVVYSSSG
jgi:hypothetical protein